VHRERPLYFEISRNTVYSIQESRKIPANEDAGISAECGIIVQTGEQDPGRCDYRRELPLLYYDTVVYTEIHALSKSGFLNMIAWIMECESEWILLHWIVRSILLHLPTVRAHPANRNAIARFVVGAGQAVIGTNRHKSGEFIVNQMKGGVYEVSLCSPSSRIYHSFSLHCRVLITFFIIRFRIYEHNPHGECVPVTGGACRYEHNPHRHLFLRKRLQRL
jgi:hypothetical protein